PGRAGSSVTTEGAPTGGWWLLRAGALQRIWDRVSHGLVSRPGTVWLVTVALMAPFAAAAGLLYNRLSYDLIRGLPADAPSVAGTRVLQEHFPAGVMGPVTVLLVNPGVDFSGPQGRELVRRVTDGLRERKDEFALADIRSLTAPLGITKAAEHAFSGSE